MKVVHGVPGKPVVGLLGRRTGIRAMLTFLIALYALVIVVALFSDRLIFLPHAAGYDLDSLAKRSHGAVQAYRVPCADGSLAAVYLPNPQAQFTLLYSHGNGEDIGDDLPVLEEFRQAGFAVFAYDYNGYGQSEGKPSEAAVYRDVEAAFDFLTGTLQVPPDRIIAFGFSLGASAAIQLAGRRPVAGLIAQAPWVSAFRVFMRVKVLPWDKFNNARAIRNVHCPVLIAQGRRDEVVPFRHGERIYKLANPPKSKLWLDGAGHNDVMLVAGREFIAAIQEFARQLPAAKDPLLPTEGRRGAPDPTPGI
jgi:pimeloyl-ACP methyl ester carboxylesterase